MITLELREIDNIKWMISISKLTRFIYYVRKEQLFILYHKLSKMSRPKSNVFWFASLEILSYYRLKNSPRYFF